MLHVSYFRMVGQDRVLHPQYLKKHRSLGLLVVTVLTVVIVVTVLIVVTVVIVCFYQSFLRRMVFCLELLQISTYVLMYLCEYYSISGVG